MSLVLLKFVKKQKKKLIYLKHFFLIHPFKNTVNYLTLK